MKDTMKYQLDNQLFAEGDDPTLGDLNPGEGRAGGTPKPSGTTVSVDYEKLANIVNNKSAITEDKVLQGYFKSQGLSPEEANQAMQQFKSQREASQIAEQEKYQTALQENAKLKDQIMNSKIDLTLTTKATELGVASEKLPFLLRLAERKDLVKEDGTVDEEKAVAALNTILEAFPDFKGEQKGSGFQKVGGNKSGNEDTEDEELKKWREEAGLN